MRIKVWAQQKWQSMRRWVYGILVALAAGGLLYAETVSFDYERATTFDDGTPMAVDQIAFTRVYCDGAQVDEEEGADLSSQADLGIGSHDCYLTHVDIWGRESIPSNTVTRVIDPPGSGPSPPVVRP